MNADQVFDAFSQLSARVHAMDTVAKLQGELRRLRTPMCGHCSMWMTNQCKPEKERGQFKSSSSFACSAFDLTRSTVRLIEKRESELEIAQAKLS